MKIDVSNILGPDFNLPFSIVYTVLLFWAHLNSLKKIVVDFIIDYLVFQKQPEKNHVYISKELSNSIRKRHLIVCV